MAWFNKAKQALEESNRVSRGAQPSQELVESKSIDLEDDSITETILYGFSEHIAHGNTQSLLQEVDEFLARGGEFDSLATLTKKLGEELAEIHQGDNERRWRLLTHEGTVSTSSWVSFEEPNEFALFAHERKVLAVEYVIPEDLGNVRVLVGTPYEVSHEAIHLEVTPDERVIIPFAYIKGIGVPQGDLNEQFILRLSLTDDDGILCDVKPFLEQDHAFTGLERDEREKSSYDSDAEDVREDYEFFYEKSSRRSPFNLRGLIGRKIYCEVFTYSEIPQRTVSTSVAHTIVDIEAHTNNQDEYKKRFAVILKSNNSEIIVKFGEIIRYCFIDED